MGKLIDARALFHTRRVARLLTTPPLDRQAVIIDITDILMARHPYNWKVFMLRWMFDQ